MHHDIHGSQDSPPLYNLDYIPNEEPLHISHHSLIYDEMHSTSHLSDAPHDALIYDKIHSSTHPYDDPHNDPIYDEIHSITSQYHQHLSVLDGPCSPLEPILYGSADNSDSILTADEPDDSMDISMKLLQELISMVAYNVASNVLDIDSFSDVEIESNVSEPISYDFNFEDVYTVSPNPVPPWELKMIMMTILSLGKLLSVSGWDSQDSFFITT